MGNHDEGYVKREHGTYKGYRIQEVMKGTNSTHPGPTDFEVSTPGNTQGEWLPLTLRTFGSLDEAKAWIDKNPLPE